MESEHSRARPIRPRTILLPLAVLIVLGASDLAAWRHASRVSGDLARGQSVQLAAHVALHIEERLGEHAGDVEMLVRDLSGVPRERRASRFTIAATRLLELEPAFLALEFDQDGAIARVPPPEAGEAPPAGPLFTDDPERVALREAAVAAGGPRVAAMATQPDGETSIVLACPVPEPVEAGPAVVAAQLSSNAVLSPALLGTLPSGFSVVASLGGASLGGGDSSREMSADLEALGGTSSLSVAGAELIVEVRPLPGSALATAPVSMRRRSIVGLALTFAVSLLLGLTLSGMDRARRQREELRTSRDRYRLLAENAGSMIYRMSVPDGRYEFVSPASEALLGYPPEEFYERPLFIRELVPPEWADFVRSRWAKLVSGDVEPSYEYQVVHRSGEVRWIRDRVTAIRDDGGRPVAVEGVVSDITDLKRAELQSRREMDLVTRIVQTSPAAIVVLDREGRITLANTLAEQILSLSAGEIAGRRYDSRDWRITDYGGRPFPQDQLPFERVRRTGRPVFGVRHALELEDGRRRLLLVNAAPFLDEDGEFDGLVATIEDVTEHMKDEERIRESEARYRQLFRHMKSGVAVYEARNEGRDFFFRDLNDAAERIDGVEKEEVVGRNVVEAFPGVEEFGLLDVMRRVWATGRSERHPTKQYADQRIVGWRENHVYKLPSGEIVAVYDDVTDRMQAVEATRLSEEMYRSLVENSNDIVYAADADGRILYVSPQALRYGVDPKEIAGRPLVELVHPEDRERVAAEFERTVTSGDEFTSTFRVLGPGGRVYWFEDYGKVQRDVEGKITGVNGTLRDVGPRMAAESGTPR